MHLNIERPEYGTPSVRALISNITSMPARTAAWTTSASALIVLPMRQNP